MTVSSHRKFTLASVLLALMTTICNAQTLRVAVAGLTHDHAHGIMNHYKKGEVVIVGIAENNKQLIERYKKSYGVPDSLFYPDLATLLKKQRPDAVLAYNSISEHIGVVEICAPLGIHVMVEKPLALSGTEADRIVALSSKFKIQVLTNYETTWYTSNQRLHELIDQGEIGAIRKMVVRDGHQGPSEIGCSPEFLAWLTDPGKNGGGAIIDFGCYGANLMTWLMKGKKPVAVTAVTRHIKPTVYPKVDDEADIFVEYEDATGIIEASWNWPFGIKDLQVFGLTGALYARDGNTLDIKKKGPYEKVETSPLAYPDDLKYLAAVLNGTITPMNDQSSLENNVIVMKILDAARQSANEGKRIVLAR